MVVVASSTGGPLALREMLGGLPADIELEVSLNTSTAPWLLAHRDMLGALLDRHLDLAPVTCAPGAFQ